MFRLSCTYLILCAATAASAVAQQSSPDTTYSLPEITIKDVRAPFYAQDLAAHLTVLGSDLLQKSGARSVAGVLGRSGAIFVRQYGPNGIGGVALRGTGPTQTTVLLDGLPLEAPQLGQVDLSLLPLSTLGEVAVLHGGAASLVGSSAIGGVISLRSADARSGRTRLSTTLGAWGERSISGRIGLGRGRIHAVVSGETFSSDGDFGYMDRARLPPVRQPRTNADASGGSLMARVTAAGDRSVLEVAAWLLESNRGVPGVAGSAAMDERQDDRLRRFWMRWVSGGTVVSASTQSSTLRYRNPTLGVDDTGRTRSHIVRVGQSRGFGDGATIHVNADLFIRSADHPALGGAVDQKALDLSVSGMLKLSRLTLMPSVRADWNMGHGSPDRHMSPGLRVRYEASGPLPAAFWSGVSSSYRVPTLNDLYWKSAGATGNPDLRPETGLSADIGAELPLAWSRVELSAFLLSVEDQITWIPDEVGTWRPQNIGRVRSIGLEASVSQDYRLDDHSEIGLAVRYALTDSQDITSRSSASSGQPLRYVPRHVVDGRASWRWRAVTFGATMRHTSRRYITTDASQWLGAYTVLGADVSVDVSTSIGLLEFRTFAENLGSAEYEVVSGYPMPPSHARFQLSLTIP